ncbi:hypothetical protein QCA50_011901 [Cerrena zonata]|uniref:FAD-binding PCMH-type domain-containing protein n=1 Tax=Cerrena zonata TaxID=2478898 RepID=A0AAW0G036_9APHY
MHLVLPLFPLYFLVTKVSALGPREPFIDIQLQREPSPLWNALNVSVEGRLFAAEPFARSCFQRVGLDVVGTFNQSLCNEVELKYTDRDQRLATFNGYSNTAWETCQSTDEGCLLDALDPSNIAATSLPAVCKQGSLPRYYIIVQQAKDVIEAFKFSLRTGINIAIKNTGHDYSGRSSSPNSLGLWISYNPDFVPNKCKSVKPTKAVTLGTGVSTGELNSFADLHNVTVVGPADTSIAFGGGYIQGGGHSAFSNSLGLASDQALEFDVVTPDGQHRTANACQNSDLFFALRGGGGSTFGVVLHVTVKAYPKISFPVVRTAFPGPASPTAQLELAKFLIQHGFEWASKGWGGYVVPSLGVTYVNPFINMSEAAAFMEPFRSLTNAINGTFILEEETSYFSFYQKFVAPTSPPIGNPIAIASRLIPADLFKTSSAQGRLSETVESLIAQNHTTLFLFAVAPFFFKDDGTSSLNPAWRSAIWHIIATDPWNFDTTKSEYEAIYSKLHQSSQLLHKLVPNGGTYLNEADLFEQDFEASFWGSNYPRLVAIKKKYDPNHLLDCWKCVGWRGQRDSRYKCYPQLGL